ncbi:MAG TPA: LEA type 2 family protein [Pelomicrobium sp.]|nr:LEA type 2 family protein [Pelomicrobium sp.]
MPPYLRSVLVLLPFLLLAGCATLPGGLEPPRVTISAMEMREATMFEQVYAIELRVQNPNNQDLPIQGLSFELEINDASFASGGSADAVVIPRLGSGIVRVEAISGLGGILQQLMKLQQGPPKSVTYRISGVAYIGPEGSRLPFEDSGEFALPAPGRR